MKNELTFTVERRFLMLFITLFWVSMIANVMFFEALMLPSRVAFVPTYHDVKTIYDREQDESYARGYLMTDFVARTDALFPEGENEMRVRSTHAIAYNPDVWCMSQTLINREMLENRCNKYWTTK